MKSKSKILTFGWREWVSLPDLGIARLKAKVDTGARTSAIHAFGVRAYIQDGRERVEFQVHPLQKNTTKVITCNADVLDKRMVSDSGGHRSERFVISTMLVIGEHAWTIEATLTARDDMLFRMLIGRTAMRNRALVNPAKSYLVGKKQQKREREHE